MKDNPAHAYRDIAKKIVAKLKDQLYKTIDANQQPDPYFNLENAIIEAMRYADRHGEARTHEHFTAIMKEFDEDNGTAQN